MVLSGHLLEHADVLFTFVHVLSAEELIELLDKTVDLVTDVGNVQRFKLTEYLLAQRIVDTVDLSAAAADKRGYEGVDLLHNTVTESNAEMLDNIIVEDLDLLEVLLADRVRLDSILQQLGEVLIVDMTRRCVGRIEGLTLGVDVDGHRTVINLIGDSEGGVIVVRGTDVPDVVGDGQLTVIEVLRVIRPRSRYDLNDPLIMRRHFEDGQHLGEVILDTGDVHLIEDDDVNVFVIGSFVQRTEQFSLIISLGKFVVVAEQPTKAVPKR